MLIANPIYDVVFKYLLEDLDIAKGFLSEMLNLTIESLSIEPQEVIVPRENYGFTVLRLDFKAIIRTPEGTKKVLIELQKGKYATDILRFRRYLGSNYQKTDGESKEILPIITIYFLGFPLEENIMSSVIKINRNCTDGITHQPITQKSLFIECLTHDSIIVQITRLNENIQSRLEQLLSVFRQHYYEKGNKKALLYQTTPIDKLQIRMLRRLQMAYASEEVQEQMQIEDEIGEFVQDTARQIEKLKADAEKLTANIEQAKADAEKLTANIEQAKADAENAKADAENAKADAENAKADAKKAVEALAEKDRLIADLLQKLQNND